MEPALRSQRTPANTSEHQRTPANIAANPLALKRLAGWSGLRSWL
jgi:hypothetical protein